MVIVYGLYQGKPPLNHVFGEYLLLHPSIEHANPSKPNRYIGMITISFYEGMPRIGATQPPA